MVWDSFLLFFNPLRGKRNERACRPGSATVSFTSTTRLMKDAFDPAGASGTAPAPVNHIPKNRRWCSCDAEVAGVAYVAKWKRRVKKVRRNFR